MGFYHYSMICFTLLQPPKLSAKDMAPPAVPTEEPRGKEGTGPVQKPDPPGQGAEPDDATPGQQVMDIRPLAPGASTATTSGGGNPPGQVAPPPVANPPGPAAPLPFTRELVHGLAEATANVHTGQTLSGHSGAAPARKPRGAPVKRSSRIQAAGRLPQQAAPAPPPRRTPRTTHSAPATEPAGKEGEGSKVKTVTYTEPYIPWSPSQEQLWECHYLLRGEGKFNMDGHISCLPSNDQRRVGNKKWLCTWQQCNRIMSSQGEARAHVMAHEDLGTAPVCSWSKSIFSNAKTLGTHLRRFHNVTLAKLRQEGNPLNILENPMHSIHA